MQDNFSIHDWQLKTAIQEYRHTLQSNIAPTKDMVAQLWDALGSYQTNAYRKDIISNANSSAGTESASYDWADLDKMTQGLVVGYFVRDRQAFNYYYGLAKSLSNLSLPSYLYED